MMTFELQGQSEIKIEFQGGKVVSKLSSMGVVKNKPMILNLPTHVTTSATLTTIR